MQAAATNVVPLLRPKAKTKRKAKVGLTDAKVRSLKPAEKGKRYQIMDAQVPGFGVRVSDKGHRAYILQARFPGSEFQTRREIGQCEIVALEDARNVARAWQKLIKTGIDPAQAAEQVAIEKQQAAKHSFESVANDWFEKELKTQRKAKDVWREFSQYFVTPWAKRPISAVTADDILAVINAKKDDGKKGMARQLFNHVSRFFTWVVDRREFGVKISPCSELNARSLFGKRIDRNRVLDDDELIALWRATFKVPYPVGPLYRALMLSPRRVEEFCRGKKAEINRRTGIWTIPAERMKGRDTEAVPHEVPLTADLLAVLDALPDHKGGPFLFSTTFGKKPKAMGGKVKDMIDAAMLIELKALAFARGEKPADELTHWVTHDIRRTIRTRMSRKTLGVDHDTREALLAHVKPGIEKVYDLHEYFDEKKDAMQKWAAELKKIVKAR
jgi:Arm DNA-binding domain